MRKFLFFHLFPRPKSIFQTTEVLKFQIFDSYKNKSQRLFPYNDKIQNFFKKFQKKY